MDGGKTFAGSGVETRENDLVKPVPDSPMSRSDRKAYDMCEETGLGETGQGDRIEVLQTALPQAHNAPLPKVGGNAQRVAGDLARIGGMDRAGCLKQWQDMFSVAPPKYLSVTFMQKVLAYEAQCKAYGGLSSSVKQALKAAFRDNRKSSAKSLPPRTLSPGAHLVREWNGRTWRVEVLPQGFLCNGRHYRSLSALAREITGAHWSGPRFFGLKGGR